MGRASETNRRNARWSVAASLEENAQFDSRSAPRQVVDDALDQVDVLGAAISAAERAGLLPPTDTVKALGILTRVALGERHRLQVCAVLRLNVRRLLEQYLTTAQLADLDERSPEWRQ